MPKERIFITVKTYPAISKKYDELVCTAGIRENGNWVRIYPVPFRKLGQDDRYKKYQWVEIDLQKNTSDKRPESFSPTDIENIEVGDFIDTGDGWKERKKIIFQNQTAYTNLEEIIGEANRNELSIVIFKPSEIKGFMVEESDPEWSEERIKLLEARAGQKTLFSYPGDIVKKFKRVSKLPYKFSYKFCDDTGKESTLMIEDWEIGALYWNCLEDSGGDKEIAVQKVREKYEREMLQKDLYFFLGTTKEHHGRAHNPFVIIGIFYPPKESQKSFGY